MKTQTVAEFLAKGGVINRIPPAEPTVKVDNVKSNNNGGVASIMSMDDADLYYGEQKKLKVKKRSKVTIDVSALPEELRKKYVDEVINGNTQEENEEA